MRQKSDWQSRMDGKPWGGGGPGSRAGQKSLPPKWKTRRQVWAWIWIH